MRRQPLTAVLAAALLAPALIATNGCSGEVASGLASIDACRAANAVSAVPAANTEGLANALSALASALPAEVQPAARQLAEQAGAGGDRSAAGSAGAAGSASQGAADAAGDTAADGAAQQTTRLQALVDVQTWVMETCGSYLTLGAAPASTAGATEWKLSDFETVLGEDSEGRYLSVIGAPSAESALDLCRQAQTAAQSGDRPIEIQVLDQLGRALAVTVDGECRVVTAPGE